MPPKSNTARSTPLSKAAIAKKPRGRPPKTSTSSTSNPTSTSMAPSKKKPGRPPKKAPIKGGWIYVADSGTSIESDVVDKGFPWVTSVVLDNHETTDFKAYTHRTAILVLAGKLALTERSAKKLTATSEGPMGGILDKSSEIFVIDARTEYKITALTKRCRFLLGLEVLDKETRDEMRERREIEWDGEMDADAVGPVTAEVRGEGEVGGDDEEEGEQGEGAENEKEGQKEPAMTSRFKHGDVDNGGEDRVVDEEPAAGDENVAEGDSEEPEVKTPPPKKNGKAKGGKK